jgi:hypothetical protein
MKRYYLYPTHGTVVATDDFMQVTKYRHSFVYQPYGPDNFKWQVIFKGKWHLRKKSHMPREFLMRLLVMGVTL